MTDSLDPNVHPDAERESEIIAAESEVYPPAEEVVANANVPNYLELREEALKDIEAYWDARAKEFVDWYEPYEKVLDDSGAPFFKWFIGGKTNIAHNALDRHAKTWRKNKLAIIWEGEDGTLRTFSYFRLWQEVNKFANVLTSMGVQKGDTVTIYMGRVPELPIAMLATAKVGAIHSVVYGGFSEQALADRIADAQSKVLITCDGAWLRGKTINLKDIADEAIRRSPVVQNVIVFKRTGQDVHMEAGRDFWWHELMSLPVASTKFDTVPMDAEDPLFILYTSGTTGKPKGVLHTCGGYQVYIATTLKYAFDVKDEDRWWKMAEKYGITILYTAPTAIRGLMRFGDAWVKRHNLDSIRLLGTVGEPINPEAWRWYHRVVGREQCPIIDTWWQTETGGFMITPTPVVPLKPGSATLPFTGIDADVVRENGESCDANEDGYLVIKRPWPGMARTVWGDPDRYVSQYWKEFEAQGWYFTGDSARRDKDGYFWIIGRMDDVIKVSGYRLGTAEVESALVSHPDVAEAACIGVPDELKGNVIHAFCILNAGKVGDDALVDELKKHVRTEVGPIAVPAVIEFVDSLPKTRSGKIMRRLLKAKVMGKPLGDTSTLAD